MALREVKKEAVKSPSATKRCIELLYVEDEDLNWEVTVAGLRERYLLDRAANAREALTLLQRKKFHAILMDIQLANSDYDGMDVTRIIRGSYQGLLHPYAQNFAPSKIPIIFLTAYASRYSRADLLAVGGDEFVTKPVDFTHLSLALGRCILKNAGYLAR